ncbi:MAG: DUF4143 domain-containing protein [Candidatus Peregrinibacteria bacterium]
MIDRSIQLPVEKSFFLFGPRQTGKSTLLRGRFNQNYSYWYDLLKTEMFTQFIAYPHLFREQVMGRDKKITHIVVDEVQRIPELLNEIHWMMEQPDSPVFVLTGSSARKLKRSKANLLAGRALTFNLYPLTFSELGNKFVLTKALRFGSLPGVYFEPSAEAAADRLRAYVETYLKEEIQLEAQVRNLSPFIRFLSIAAFENGNQINYSGIAQSMGITYQTVKSYFEILEDTLIGRFLYPYSKSIRKRLSKHPKFYFFDTGVTRALTQKLTVPLSPHTPDFGNAFEQFVILEIMRMAHYQKKDWSFSYYRTANGAEVDLIIEQPSGKTVAVEIKAANMITPAHLKGLKSFHEVCPSAELFCVSLEPYQRKNNGITIIPWQRAVSLEF